MLPPEKRYPSPGTCKISLIKISKVAWTSIVDPLFVLIVVWFPPIRIGNDFLFPSKSESIGSITWSDPTDHAINVSEYILSIDNWNSEKLNEVLVGIPMVPPIETVNTSFILYPYNH